MRKFLWAETSDPQIRNTELETGRLFTLITSLNITFFINKTKK